VELNFIQTLFEAGEGPRIPHPEDSIFAGTDAAQKMIAALQEVIANPGAGSIKWDGGIALFFGYDPTGQFFINDKYMPEGFYAHSPADWQKYDTEMKKSRVARTDLYPQLAAIWEGMKASVTEKSVFKGDLMWTGELQPVQGKFVFKPTTVEYRVPVNSALGKLFAGKAGGIVVHQKDGAPWDGKSGLQNAGNVAIISPKAGVTFTLKNPVKLVNDAKKAASNKAIDEFLAGLAGVVKSSMQTYMNKKITKQTNEPIDKWLEKALSKKQYELVVTGANGNDGYIMQNSAGLTALFAAWNAIYVLKDNLCQQLEPQVQGFEQWTGGQQAGEGFVFPTSQGLIKLVNRAGFGAAHFNK
jgi:hypothetical protein